MKKATIQKQKVVATKIKEVNSKDERSYQEFEKFKWEVEIYKLNLIDLPKILEFNKRRRNIESKNSGIISWNNLSKTR